MSIAVPTWIRCRRSHDFWNPSHPQFFRMHRCREGEYDRSASAMAHYLDVESWARRDVFEFFRGFDKPYFNVCTRLDVTNLLAFLRSKSNVSVSLTYHYFALRMANEIEPFRYRLRDGRVLVHDVIHGGTTVLLPNETFTLTYFDYH